MGGGRCSANGRAMGKLSAAILTMVVVSIVVMMKEIELDAVSTHTRTPSKVRGLPSESRVEMTRPMRAPHRWDAGPWPQDRDAEHRVSPVLGL